MEFLNIYIYQKLEKNYFYCMNIEFISNITNDINELKLNFDTEIMHKRKLEFLRLHDNYKNINLLNIDLNSNPFCYPCLVDTIESAEKIVAKLKQEGKTIYRYWNLVPENFNEYKFYSRLVPMPIELS